MFLLVTIVTLILIFICALNYDSGSTLQRLYSENLDLQIKKYIRRKENFVKLDFKSFKPIFLLAPDKWDLCEGYINNLYHFEDKDHPACIVIFEKRKDYKKAISLYDEYKELKEKQRRAKLEIKNFESFKSLIQVDIDEKKSEAEKELQEVNMSIDKLSEVNFVSLNS